MNPVKSRHRLTAAGSTRTPLALSHFPNSVPNCPSPRHQFCSQGPCDAAPRAAAAAPPAAPRRRRRACTYSLWQRCRSSGPRPRNRKSITALKNVQEKCKRINVRRRFSVQSLCREQMARHPTNARRLHQDPQPVTHVRPFSREHLPHVDVCHAYPSGLTPIGRPTVTTSKWCSSSRSGWQVCCVSAPFLCSFVFVLSAWFGYCLISRHVAATSSMPLLPPPLQPRLSQG